MAEYLDVRTFLSWVRSLLDDFIAGDGGGDWNDSGKRTPSTQRRTDISGWAPTLEQALKAWVRDRNQLQLADRAVARYFETIRATQRIRCQRKNGRRSTRFERCGPSFGANSCRTAMTAGRSK